MPRHYAIDEGERYFSALSQIGRVYDQFRMELPGDKDPLQFWPHHFDLSFVLLGTQMKHTVEGDFPSQITFGFAPPDRGMPSSYFYVNPFPFDDRFTSQELPDGAVWHTAIWQGAMLPYANIAEKADAEKQLMKFLKAAYKAEKGVI